jgi:MoaD family protein
VNVTVRYHSQLRQAAGVAAEAVPLPEGAAVLDLLRAIAGRRPDLARHLIDEARGKPPSLLVFVNDRQVADGHPLRPGDEVVLMTPIAGGAS